MIIGVVGRSEDLKGRLCSIGTGKDTVADAMLDSNTVKIAFADPIKRFLMELYGFTVEQLWGPSALREQVDPLLGFSPRQALKTLGDGWGRGLYERTWINYLITDAQLVLRNEYTHYTNTQGSYASSIKRHTRAVIVPDVRYKNELQALKDAGAKVCLVRRPVPEVAATEEDLQHRSENDLNNVATDDAIWDAVIHNDCSKEELEQRAALVKRQFLHSVTTRA